MRLHPIYIILLAGSLGLPAAAQSWQHQAESPGLAVEAYATYRSGSGAAYPGADIALTYARGGWHAGIAGHFNEQLNFTFAPGDLIIYVDDPAVGFSRGTRLDARPDRYTLDLPVEGFAAFRFGALTFRGQLSMLTQTSRVEVPEARLTGDELYVINWVPEIARQTRVSGAVTAGLRIGSSDLTAGVIGLPVLRVGDAHIRHGFRPRATPYVAAALPLFSGELGGGATSHTAAVLYEHRLSSNWRSPESALTARIGYHTGVRDHDFHMMEARVMMPAMRRSRISVAVAHGWTRGNPLRPGSFQAWQAGIVPGGGNELSLGLPHTSVRVGARIAITGSRYVPLEIVDIDMRHDAVFTAWRRQYESTPLGFVRIRNTSSRRVRARLVAETSDSGGRFRSDPFTVDAGNERVVPVFLRATGADETHHERLLIAAVTTDGRSTDASVPIVTFGRNAWNGDTAMLRYFLTPEHPEVRRFAQNELLRAQSEVGDERFRLISTFLERLGRGLSFVEDPTTTLSVDHVQYPIETLLERRGDCEDLTVFLASSLMAVGIKSAIVDVRPANNTGATGSPRTGGSGIGHLFLLVDTGIRPAEMSDAGLNEFQGVTRTNGSGHPTIWIPVETTVLGDGFDVALQEGVRQYAAAALERDDPAAAPLLVVDL